MICMKTKTKCCASIYHDAIQFTTNSLMKNNLPHDRVSLLYTPAYFLKASLALSVHSFSFFWNSAEASFRDDNASSSLFSFSSTVRVTKLCLNSTGVLLSAPALAPPSL